jgi:hypothetical protein
MSSCARFLAWLITDQAWPFQWVLAAGLSVLFAWLAQVMA